MDFGKLNKEHINLALKDFKEKGVPEGFKQSAFFDVKIEVLLATKAYHGLCKFLR
jgi:hypothetical protein